jgi:hypothetical protein
MVATRSLVGKGRTMAENETAIGRRDPLRVHFTDFWPGFDPQDNWMANVLRREFDLVVTPDDPDVVIYSCYGRTYQDYRCRRVFLSWENRGWGFSQCDAAFSSDRVRSERHLRLPLWVAWLEQPFRQPVIDPHEILRGKVGFASLVVSNGSSPTRNALHSRMTEYAVVASGGRYMNNVGGPVADKGEFIARYKFNLACENSSYPGYVTEKLLQALQANTIPIYWGAPDVGLDFNTKRFVNVHDYESHDALMARIIELDRDDDAYCEVLAEPWFPNGRLPECADLDAVGAHVRRAVESTVRPVAQRSAAGRRPRAIVDRLRIRNRHRNRRT